MKKMAPEKKQKLVKWVFIIAGLLLALDTVFIRMRSNWNLGVVLPALLGIPLLAYGIFKPKFDLWFQTSKPGKFVKWFFICGYIAIIALILVSTGMMMRAANTQPDPGAGAVVVLGAGIRGDEPTWTLKNRLDKAIEYYSENPDTLIVTSGGYGLNETYSEAYAMKKYLTDAGVPADAVLMEDRSTSTNENFRFSKELLDDVLGGDYRVVYVTNDYHILRAGINAKEEGLTAQGLAAPTPIYIVPNSFARESLALLAAYVFGVG